MRSYLSRFAFTNYELPRREKDIDSLYKSESTLESMKLNPSTRPQAPSPSENFTAQCSIQRLLTGTSRNPTRTTLNAAKPKHIEINFIN